MLINEGGLIRAINRAYKYRMLPFFTLFLCII